MKKEYRKALSEVNQILLNTDEEVVAKIPKRFQEFVKTNMDKEHKIEIKEGESLIEQDIRPETKQILALIYRDYICSKEKRNDLINQEIEKRKKREESYEINFQQNQNRKESIEEKLENSEEKALIKPEEKWYQKIINKILKIFKIK